MEPVFQRLTMILRFRYGHRISYDVALGAHEVCSGHHAVWEFDTFWNCMSAGFAPGSSLAEHRDSDQPAA